MALRLSARRPKTCISIYPCIAFTFHEPVREADLGVPDLLRAVSWQKGTLKLAPNYRCHRASCTMEPSHHAQRGDSPDDSSSQPRSLCCISSGDGLVLCDYDLSSAVSHQGATWSDQGFRAVRWQVHLPEPCVARLHPSDHFSRRPQDLPICIVHNPGCCRLVPRASVLSQQCMLRLHVTQRVSCQTASRMPSPSAGRLYQSTRHNDLCMCPLLCCHLLCTTCRAAPNLNSKASLYHRHHLICLRRYLPTGTRPKALIHGIGFTAVVFCHHESTMLVKQNL
jgi:hypothetical protein